MTTCHSKCDVTEFRLYSGTMIDSLVTFSMFKKFVAHHEVKPLIQKGFTMLWATKYGAAEYIPKRVPFLSQSVCRLQCRANYFSRKVKIKLQVRKRNLVNWNTKKEFSRPEYDFACKRIGTLFTENFFEIKWQEMCFSDQNVNLELENLKDYITFLYLICENPRSQWHVQYVYVWPITPASGEVCTGGSGGG